MLVLVVACGWVEEDDGIWVKVLPVFDERVVVVVSKEGGLETG